MMLFEHGLAVVHEREDAAGLLVKAFVKQVFATPGDNTWVVLLLAYQRT